MYYKWKTKNLRSVIYYDTPAWLQKNPMTCVTLTFDLYWHGNDTWHIIPSGVVFVPHMNMIHEISI